MRSPFTSETIRGCESDGTADSPYLTRTSLLETRFGNVYLHYFHRSDRDDLHDHPWNFVSVVLWRGYVEVTECPMCVGIGYWAEGHWPPEQMRCPMCEGSGRLRSRVWPGMVLFRRAEHRHRVELVNGRPAVTLLLRGPYVREWASSLRAGFTGVTTSARKVADMETQVVERPILFSGPMVREVLAGRKTQTRRVVRWKSPEPGLNLGFSGLSAAPYCTGHPEPEHGWCLYSRRGDGCWETRSKATHCPYGNTGDRLWVRETWADCNSENGPVIAYRAGGERFLMDEPDMLLPDGSMDYSKTPKCLFSMWDTDLRQGADDCHWRPSIFLPRWASLCTLDVCEVRVQRVQSISEEDAVAEGCTFDGQYYAGGLHPVKGTRKVFPTARDAFRDLWDSINGKRPGCSWADNPWVWAITFRRVTE